MSEIEDHSYNMSPVYEQEDLQSHPGIKKALKYIEDNYPRFFEKQIEIAHQHAPTFKEKARGEFMAREFEKAGLEKIHMDEAGNVLGSRPGKSDRTLAISAHLDTVFPEDLKIEVKQDGEKWTGPGLVDNSLGLMAMLALVEALNVGKIQTEHNLVFAGTVGEEGLGNLRGAKYLFEESPLKGSIDAFISIDSADPKRIVNGALGSQRYRIIVKGPGGHSWNDFGRVNPVHTIGRIISRFTSIPVSGDPKTTYNVGVIKGGTSINTIPSEASMEVDMRSINKEALGNLENEFLAAVKHEVDEENSNRQGPDEKLEIIQENLGYRPGGETPAGNSLVKVAQWATKAVDMEPELEFASTDSNIPISIGIPAITIGAGGKAGNLHTEKEWYDNRDAFIGLQRNLLLVMAFDCI